MMIVFGLGRVPNVLRDTPVTGPNCLPLDKPTLRLWDLVPQWGQGPGAGQIAAGQLAAIAAQLDAFCGDWNHAGSGFVRAYIAALTAAVMAREDELAARAGTVAGLVQPIHWALGAPLPMPRAWPPGADGRACAAPVDMAFWVDGRLHVLCLGGTTRLPSQRRFLDELAARNARVLDLPVNEMDQGDLLARLGPGFADPFGFPGLPQSPFRPRPLGRPMPALA